MQIYSEQLSSALQGTLLPLYIISGDEPLQMQECGDQLRAAGREAGFVDREVIDVDSRFDWESLRHWAVNPGLFADQRLLELRLQSLKIGKDGSAALVDYCENLQPENLLLIVSPKVDKAQQRSKWWKTVDQVGGVIQIWPIDNAKMPQWLQQRAKQKGIHLETDALNWLVQQVEGNLLAADQELEKLAIIHVQSAVDNRSHLTQKEVMDLVGNMARYSIFSLIDAILAADPLRIARIVPRLEQEGEEPVKIIWFIEREVRLLQGLSRAIQLREPLSAWFRSRGVWQKRQPLMQKAASRFSEAIWTRLQQRILRVEKIAKGGESGNCWDELLQLSLLLAGKRIL